MYFSSTSTGSSTISAQYGFNVVMMPRVDLDMPVLRGEGSPSWSTCTDLVLTPVHIHDGNTYYRALGFEWPFRGISRKDLRVAYSENGGPDDPFMTYAFSMLLDKDFRQIYDRLQFGQQALDRYLWETIMAKAKRVASDAAAQGQELNVRDIIESWGIKTSDADSNEPVADGEGPLTDAEQESSALSDPADTVPDTWSWGYYAWRSSCEDLDRLASWQRLLLGAAREHNLRAKLAVGFVGKTSRRTITAQINDCYVIFLNEDEQPDGALAASAVGDVTRMINK